MDYQKIVQENSECIQKAFSRATLKHFPEQENEFTEGFTEGFAEGFQKEFTEGIPKKA